MKSLTVVTVGLIVITKVENALGVVKMGTAVLEIRNFPIQMAIVAMLK